MCWDMLGYLISGQAPQPHNLIQLRGLRIGGMISEALVIEGLKVANRTCLPCLPSTPAFRRKPSAWVDMVRRNWFRKDGFGSLGAWSKPSRDVQTKQPVVSKLCDSL